MPQTDLACLLCQLDDTITYADKDITYTRAELNSHLAGTTHRREMQLRRAFCIDMDDEEQAQCPICKTNIQGADAFVAHCEDEHPEQIEF